MSGRDSDRGIPGPSRDVGWRCSTGTSSRPLNGLAMYGRMLMELAFVCYDRPVFTRLVGGGEKIRSGGSFGFLAGVMSAA